MGQGDTESNNSYLTPFKLNVQNLELVGDTNYFYSNKHMIHSGDAPNKMKKRTGQRRVPGHVFHQKKQPWALQGLLDQLQQSLYLRCNKYPTTLVHVYNTLIQYSGQFTSNRPCDRNPANGYRGRNARHRDVSFTQASIATPVPGRNTKGYYTNECFTPDKLPGQTSIGALQISVALAQRRHHPGNTGAQPEHNKIINRNWYLLDTSSTATTMMNSLYIINVQNCSKGEELLVHTTGGDKVFNKKGELTLLPMTGYYNPHSLASILSFKEVANIPNVCITMDTLHKKAITITLSNNTTIKFTKCADGLYFFDPAHNNSKNTTTDYIPLILLSNIQLISTVKEKNLFLPTKTFSLPTRHVSCRSTLVGLAPLTLKICQQQSPCQL